MPLVARDLNECITVLRKDRFGSRSALLSATLPLAVGNSEISWAGRYPLDADGKVRELPFISLAACLGIGLAWRQDADYFAMFFAAATAIAGVEAVRRSL